MLNGLYVISYFLIEIFFSLLFLLLWGRMFLRYFRVSYINQFHRAIIKLTDPIIRPIKNLMPSSVNINTNIDWPCFVLIVIASLIKFTTLSLMQFGLLISVSLIVKYSLFELIIQPCNLLFYLIILRVIISWVNPYQISPALDAVYTVTEPFLAWARKLIPPISGFDFSPMIILLILYIIVLFFHAV